MTGAETLDVARDAIWTIVVVFVAADGRRSRRRRGGVAVPGADADPGADPGVRAKILAIFVTLLLALPFMADSLHGHMMRISSRIIGG